MSVKTEYYFACIEEQMGEYEFNEKMLIKVLPGQDIEEVSNYVLGSYRSEEPFVDDNGNAESDCGMIRLSYHSLSQEPLLDDEVDVLKDYLTVLGAPVIEMKEAA